MRSVWVCLLLLPLAGCLDDEDPEPATDARILLPTIAAPPGHLGTVIDLAGSEDAVQFPDNGSVAFDVMHWINEDTQMVILARPLQAGHMSYREEMYIETTRGPALGADGESASDACIYDMRFSNAAGDDLLLLLDGRPAGNTTWPPPNGGYTLVAGGGASQVPGTGWSGGSGRSERDLEAGAWFLAAWATSGHSEANLKGPEDYWNGTIQFDVPFELYLLPPMRFLCGVGMERWDDAVGATAMAAVGGHIALDGLLGAAIDLRPLQGTAPANELQITFGPERTSYQGNGHFGRAALEPHAMRLDNTIWTGALVWRLQSIYDPFVTEAPLIEHVPGGVRLSYATPEP